MKIRVLVLLFVLFFHHGKTIAQRINRDQKKTIIIDAGHGGLDSGAISKNGLQEKDIVLDIARSMVYWNHSLLESKYDIYLTRTTDTLISLNDRVKLPKHLKPDVFISLHCNHSDNRKIKGAEAYVAQGHVRSLEFAHQILNRLNIKLGIKMRNPKYANFQVLREARQYCPVVLIELGYLSNGEESEYLEKKASINALALALLEAINEVL